MDSNKKSRKISELDPKVEQRLKELEADLKQLAGIIDTVEDEKLQITNQLKKALADYQNLERSSGDRVELRVMHLKKSMAEDIIAVLDDLKFAEDAKQKLNLGSDEQAWADGVVASVRKINKALETLGIVSVDVVAGTEFDANQHEAVAVVPCEKDDKPGTVKQVLQTGYRLGEFVVRPARVIVTQK